MFADILAWNALTDENPLNDGAGWQIATGTTLTGAEPLLGIGARVWALLDGGPGRAEPAPPDPGLLARLDDSGTITGCLHNIHALGTGGALLVQQVRGPDGADRHVVHLAGMGAASATRAPRTCWAPCTPWPGPPRRTPGPSPGRCARAPRPAPNWPSSGTAWAASPP